MTPEQRALLIAGNDPLLVAAIAGAIREAVARLETENERLRKRLSDAQDIIHRRKAKAGGET